MKNLITVELSPYFLPAVLKKKMPTFSRCTCSSIAKLTLASVAHRLQCKGAEDRQDTQEGAYTSHPLDLPQKIVPIPLHRNQPTDCFSLLKK